MHRLDTLSAAGGSPDCAHRRPRAGRQPGAAGRAPCSVRSGVEWREKTQKDRFVWLLLLLRQTRSWLLSSRSESAIEDHTTHATKACQAIIGVLVTCSQWRCPPVSVIQTLHVHFFFTSKKEDSDRQLAKAEAVEVFTLFRRRRRVEHVHS